MSGGGARGLALIGVLKVFEREGVRVNFIGGVSMGAIVGGLYSCGYTSQEIEEIAHQVDWGEIFSQSPLRSSLLTTQKGQSEKSLFHIRFQGWKPVMPRAITSAQKLNQLLEKLTSRAGIRPNISFDYLTPPLRIVCTDLLTGARVVLSSGNVGEALRASMAIPVAFTPVQIGGHLLVDGGLVDPIPTALVKEAVGFPVVAVDMSSDLRPASQISDVVDIADQTTTIMTIDKKENSLALADYSISPELGGYTNTDFSDIDGLIEAGEDAAEQAIPALKRLIETRWQTDSGGKEYRIRQSEITELTNMPRTFFASVFSHSEKMTSTNIEANIKRAFESGYLADAWAEVIPETVDYSIVYHLRDHPRVSAVRFAGITVMDEVELIKLVETRAGMVLNSRMLSRDRSALENYYLGHGYGLVRITSEFGQSDGALTFKIDEGLINNIQIEGARRTRDWVIMRHIPFRVGDLYDSKRGERAIDELYGTGLFETAKLVAEPESTGVTLVIKVVEKPYNYIRGGARFDLEYKSRAFVDFVADNIFGGGQEVYFSATIGEKKRSASLNIHTDRIFRTLFTNLLELDYEEFKRNHYMDHEYQGYYKQKSYGGEIAPGRQIPQLGTIYLVGLMRHFEWYEPNRTGKQEFNKLALGFRSVVDTRDAISFPENGKYHYFELEFASDIRNEKTAYTRLQTSFGSFYRLTRGLNFHPIIAVGISSAIMPYFDEFSLGGLNSFLGLFEHEYLGDKTVQGTVELRDRVSDRLYILARYNLGNIWTKLESIKLSELRHGGGLGVGLKTPIGPIQTWYGRTDAGRDAFYLDIGHEW